MIRVVLSGALSIGIRVSSANWMFMGERDDKWGGGHGLTDNIIHYSININVHT